MPHLASSPLVTASPLETLATLHLAVQVLSALWIEMVTQNAVASPVIAQTRIQLPVASRNVKGIRIAAWDLSVGHTGKCLNLKQKFNSTILCLLFLYRDRDAFSQNFNKIFHFILISKNLFWATGWSTIDRNMINDLSVFYVFQCLQT